MSEPSGVPNDGIIFLLWHLRNGDEENAKLLGAFSSREKALASQQRALDREGFRDFPEDFVLDEYQLDVDQWVDGFTIEEF